MVLVARCYQTACGQSAADSDESESQSQSELAELQQSQLSGDKDEEILSITDDEDS